MGRLGRAWRALTGREDSRVGGAAAYEGGRVKRTDPDFIPPNAGPNLLAEQYLDLTRRRQRHLFDNHPNLNGARETAVNNVVGCGPYPEPNTGHKEVDKQIKEILWTFWDHADVGRETSVPELMAEGFREECAVGEYLSYFPMAPEWRGLPAAPAIEIVDTDRLPLNTGFAGMMAAGKAITGRARQGVEFDALGRRVAYHVYNDHPQDGSFAAMTMDLRKIPASDAFLGFERRRVKQIRGIPWCVSLSETTRMEDAYHESNILLGMAACNTSVLFKGVEPPKKSKSYSDGQLVDGRGRPVVDSEPGSYLYASNPNAGGEVLGGNLPGPAFGGTMEVLLRRMAAGANMSYTAFTRDSSKATFAAQRADSLEDRKGYRRKQEKLARGILLPWYYRLIDWGVANGKIKLSDEQLRTFIADRTWIRQCTVVFPGWEWVNPAQEAAADKIALEIGAVSRQEIAQNRGRHWQDVLDEELAVEVYERDERTRLGLPPRMVGNTTVNVAPDNEQPKDEQKDEDKPAPAKRPAKKGLGGRFAELLERTS